MQVHLELYASLMQYLPTQAQRHRVTLEIPAGSSAHDVLDRCAVPHEKAHLVLKNGVFMHQPERDAPTLEQGDVIAVWPPVAGG
ncbi:MAG: MoaD/ThiS family protein [Gammaproteobacteria bacterium]|nr:MoaD/ThiS family protein [Gammaproteobacteria bacterium]